KVAGLKLEIIFVQVSHAWGSPRVPRAGERVLAIANFLYGSLSATAITSQEKFVSARRRNQHARRVRSPESPPTRRVTKGGVRSAQRADPTSVIFRDRVPIHHVPPSLEVIGTTVLVLEIVGMLPHVDAEDRRVAIHQRTILVWRRNNFELSVLILDEPRPAAAEPAHSGGG